MTIKTILYIDSPKGEKLIGSFVFTNFPRGIGDKAIVAKIKTLTDKDITKIDIEPNYEPGYKEITTNWEKI